MLERGTPEELVLGVCKLYSGGPLWPFGPKDAAISCQVKNYYGNCVVCSELVSS